MKKFLIKELSLSNFKGQTRTFTPNEMKTIVKGANGVGKTTIYKAFCWLLTSYTDAINVKNHELYDSRLELTHETPVASVKASIIVNDESYIIERRAKAKFSRKRGSQEYTKDSSDSYTMLIDEIEVSASDFSFWVESHLGSVDLLPYMIMGEKFCNLVIDDKKAARKILEQVTGEITFDMMKGDYSLISDDLKKYSIEQLLERYKNQRKPLVQRVDIIDALTNVKTEELKDLACDNFDGIKNHIDELNKELKNIDDSLSDISKRLKPLISNRENHILKISQQKSCIELEKKSYELSFNKRLMELQSEIETIDYDNKRINEYNKSLMDDYDNACAQLSSERKMLETLNKERERLLDAKKQIKGKVFQGENCSFCGQPLPEYDLDVAKKKFNANKEKELEAIVSEGKIVKEKITLVEKKIKGLEEFCENKPALTQLKDKKNLLDKIECEKKQFVAFENTDTYKKLYKQLNELESSIPTIERNDESLVTRKKEINEELQALNRQYGKLAIVDKINSDIENCKIEKKNIGSEIARLERCIGIVQEYEEERANIISEKINDLLDDCKIVMYSRQKDGSLKPDCVIVNNDGVKYATLNNSARILTCLSIQRLFCKHFNIAMPIFIDESSVFDSSHLPTYDAQTIYLFASDDKFLNISNYEGN